MRPYDQSWRDAERKKVQEVTPYHWGTTLLVCIILVLLYAVVDLNDRRVTAEIKADRVHALSSQYYNKCPKERR